MTRLPTMTAAALTMAALMVAAAVPPVASAAPREAVTDGGTWAPGNGHTAKSKCASVRPVTAFYEAGRISSFPLTVPHSSCTTISVSNIRDAADASDRCQTFLVAFLPADGSGPTYTEPVTACSVPADTRIVLAWQVPDGAVYRILYNIDYLEPSLQVVRYKAWH